MGSMRIVNLGQALHAIDNFVDNDVDQKILEAFQYVGESFIRSARLNRTFDDQTGNLQSSIGYVIAKDGKVLKETITGVGDGQKPEGKEEGQRLAQAVIRENSNGWVLVGVAGMEYGIYVEARGKDVISGSVPETTELMKDIVKAFK